MIKVKEMPKDKGIDHTMDLLKEGYLFIGKRADLYKTEVFETRLMGKKMICITGEEGAKLFYNEELFERRNVMPMRVKETLTGKGGVQGLDGHAHSVRKSLFINLVNEDRQKELIKIAADTWEETVKSWPSKDYVVLYEEARKVLCKSAFKWTGVPYDLADNQLDLAARCLGNMIFGFGRMGVVHWKGRVSRNAMEAYFMDIIGKVRDEQLKISTDSILYEISNHRDEKGNILDLQIAAVEILNIIRPIVAIAVYITFTALALYENPEIKRKLVFGGKGDKERFVEEVRRIYPFSPFVGAKVKCKFVWKNYEFNKGDLVLLDLYGINNDPKLWQEPHIFNPDRYKEKEKNLYNFMPQGGGDLKGHRCVGDAVTRNMMEVALEVLVNKINYELPAQDLKYSMSKIPTMPPSGFIIKSVTFQQ